MGAVGQCLVSVSSVGVVGRCRGEVSWGGAAYDMGRGCVGYREGLHMTWGGAEYDMGRDAYDMGSGCV